MIPGAQKEPMLVAERCQTCVNKHHIYGHFMACSDVLPKAIRTGPPKGAHDHSTKSNPPLIFPERMEDLVAPRYTREIFQRSSVRPCA